MGNYTEMRLLLANLTGQDNIITTPKIFIAYTGDVTTALLLNQIIFYSDKSKRMDGFFYKTYREWNEELCLTERQVRYSVKKLKDMGIVETELHRANGSPTVHYKLLFEKFVESILTFCQDGSLQIVSMEGDKLSGTITERTTKNTTKEKDIVAQSTTAPSENQIKKAEKQNNHIQEVVEYLNNKADKSFKANTAKTASLIKARFAEGFSLDDFKKVIDLKCGEWLKTDMNKYLRPATLFNSEKFESYLNEVPNDAGTKQKQNVDWSDIL